MYGNDVGKTTRVPSPAPAAAKETASIPAYTTSPIYPTFAAPPTSFSMEPTLRY